MSLGPLSIEIFLLLNTTYYLFHTHVTREFEFIAVKKHIVPYNQIVDIKVNISIWDKVCNAGDIVLNTAEDVEPNLILHFIENPEKVEKHVVRAQYISSNFKNKKLLGYRDEKSVAADSCTETFVAMKFFIDNWRWGGVPFYIRTGKRLATRVTEVVIYFKKTPHLLFKQESSGTIS